MSDALAVHQRLALAYGSLAKGQVGPFQTHLEQARAIDPQSLSVLQSLDDAAFTLAGDLESTVRIWNQVAARVNFQLAFLDAYALYTRDHPMVPSLRGRVLVDPAGRLVHRSAALALFEIAEHTGLPIQEVLRRHLAAHGEYDAAWDRLPAPEGRDPEARDVSRFYAECEPSLFGTGVAAHEPAPMGVRNLIASQIRAAGFASVLDFGAGAGLLDVFLVRQGTRRVVHVDIDSCVLAFARWRYDRLGIRPEIVATAGELPDVAGPFDAVVTLEVLEHLPDPPAAIRWFASILRPGGRVYASYSFALVERSHLVANRAYAATAIDLFREAGLVPVGQVAGVVHVFERH